MPAVKEQVEVTIRWDRDACNDEEGSLCDVAARDSAGYYRCMKHDVDLSMLDYDCPLRCDACKKDRS